MDWVFHWCLKQWFLPLWAKWDHGVGGRQEETLCSREDVHYKTEVLLPANLQSENPQAAEPEAENVLGRSCCVAAFVVLFSREDEGKLLTVTVLSSKRFWFLKSSPCAFPEAPRPCLTQTSAHPCSPSQMWRAPSSTRVCSAGIQTSRQVPFLLWIQHNRLADQDQ